MNEDAYLSPKDLAAKLKDARCTSCKKKFTEEDFEGDEVIIVPKLRLAHYKCFFKKSTRPKIKQISLSEIMRHPNFSLVPSDYFDDDQDEEE